MKQYTNQLNCPCSQQRPLRINQQVKQGVHPAQLQNQEIKIPLITYNEQASFCKSDRRHYMWLLPLYFVACQLAQEGFLSSIFILLSVLFIFLPKKSPAPNISVSKWMLNINQYPTHLLVTNLIIGPTPNSSSFRMTSSLTWYLHLYNKVI